jgi:hypothetical protein
MQTNRIDEVKDAVAAKVAALTNLTDEQRGRVLEIAHAAAVKVQGREPNYEGLANLVRSQAARPTPNTLEANNGKL